MRAIAVLSVLIFHVFPQYMPGGFIGVDIFFVISGFLIFGIIFDSLQANASGCFPGRDEKEGGSKNIDIGVFPEPRRSLFFQDRSAVQKSVMPLE